MFFLPILHTENLALPIKIEQTKSEPSPTIIYTCEKLQELRHYQMTKVTEVKEHHTVYEVASEGICHRLIQCIDSN